MVDSDLIEKGGPNIMALALASNEEVDLSNARPGSTGGAGPAAISKAQNPTVAGHTANQATVLAGHALRERLFCLFPN